MAAEAFAVWPKKFRATGDICPVRLGCTRDEIRALFGEPDAVGGTSRKHGVSRIWKYGDLGFHFDGDVLALIFSETPEGIADISIPLRPQN
jgi:hypothetical protein